MLAELTPDILFLVLAAGAGCILKDENGKGLTVASLCSEIRNMYDAEMQTLVLLAANKGSHSGALFNAAQHGKPDICRVLLKKYGSVANYVIGIAFELAAVCGHADVCAILMDAVVSSEHRVNLSRILQRAARKGHADVCVFLMQHQARADNLNSKALQMAALNGHADVCALLMDPKIAGEQHRAKANDDNSMALWMAAEKGHADVCALLMDPAVAGEHAAAF